MQKSKRLQAQTLLTAMKIEDLTRTLKLDKKSDPIVELISSNEKTSRKISLEIRKMSLNINETKKQTVEEICKKIFNEENRLYNDSH